MSTGDDVAKGAGVATGIAAAACAEFSPIGSGLCALGAAIVSAFVALGVALDSAFGVDTFHPDKQAAHAWAILARLLPMSLLWGVDNTGAPEQGRRLMAYWRLDSGEVPPGKFGNDGVWSNPADTRGGGNAYLAHPETHDPEEPLMRPGVLERAQEQYNAWVKAGSKLEDFARYNPTPHASVPDSRAMLALMRRHPAVFQSLNTWSQFNAPVYGGAPITNKQLAAEAVKEARRRAGEHGPDRDEHGQHAGVLSSIFGDVSLPAHDPHMKGAPGDAPVPGWTTGEKIVAIVGAGAVLGLVLQLRRKHRR